MVVVEQNMIDTVMLESSRLHYRQLESSLIFIATPQSALVIADGGNSIYMILRRLL